MYLSSLIALAAAGLAATSQAQQWPVGREREVDEGVYMKVLASQDGWRVWRIETRGGVNCKAYKSIRGAAHPAPVGVSDFMTGGTPALEISKSFMNEQRFSYRWHARHFGGVRGKYRTIGSRFWEEDRGPFSELKAGEEPIEVVVTSWEYPEILVGHSEQSGVLDLAGLKWAQEQVRGCS